MAAPYKLITRAVPYIARPTLMVLGFLGTIVSVIYIIDRYMDSLPKPSPSDCERKKNKVGKSVDNKLRD